MTPLLSIVIPTRNRAGFLDALLTRLGEEVAPHAGEVEVIVGDNCSVDDTRAVAERHAKRHPFIYYRRQTEPKPTAEESLVASVEFAAGKYVWSLGDDDMVFPGGLERLMSLLRGGRFKLIVSNFIISHTVDEAFATGFVGLARRILPLTVANAVNKGHAKSCYFDGSAPVLAYDRGRDFFRAVGFTFLTPAFSSLCFEREAFSAIEWPPLFSRSRIYAHAFGLFSVFAESPCALLVNPLIDYRTNDPVVEMTGITNVYKAVEAPHYYPWTLGLVRLADYLRGKAGLGDTYFYGVSELVFDRYLRATRHELFHYHILRALTADILMRVRGIDMGRSYTDAELSEFTAFFACDPVPEAHKMLDEALTMHQRFVGGVGDQAEWETRALALLRKIEVSHRRRCAAWVAERPAGDGELMLGGVWTRLKVGGKSVREDGSPARTGDRWPAVHLLGRRRVMWQTAWYRAKRSRQLLHAATGL